MHISREAKEQLERDCLRPETNWFYIPVSILDLLSAALCLMMETDNMMT